MTSVEEQSAAVRHARRTAVGFAVGSVLFAVGVPLSLVKALPASVAGWVFFAGSVFFTLAGLRQFLTSRDELEPEGSSGVLPWLGDVLRPRTADWTASAVQLVGTLAFNVTTLRGALNAAGRSADPASAVWFPDAVGSVLFLVSSGIAMAPEVRWRRHAHARDRSWSIAALNLTGSIFFGASAVGAYTIPSDDQLLSAWWSNVGTFVGAVCFLAGAILLYPRRT